LRAKLVEELNALDDLFYCRHSAVRGKIKRDWQQNGYVLSLFVQRKLDAKKAYRNFIKKVAMQGRRPELTGGGLLRSINGWEALSALRNEPVRINGMSEF
jgi:hypothetical protein